MVVLLMPVRRAQGITANRAQSEVSMKEFRKSLKVNLRFFFSSLRSMA
jgi:hypothetical protein